MDSGVTEVVDEARVGVLGSGLSSLSYTSNYSVMSPPSLLSEDVSGH